MINVIGLGYIGLPTALMLASHGIEVIGTDYNRELVNTLNAGKTTFKEDGLDELFNAAVRSGIRFTTEYQKTDTYIVSVPTPYDKFSKKVDACYAVAAVKEILNVCPDETTIVVESTVSPGTMDRFIRPIVNESERRINLVHAPERIIPGNMVFELIHNNRTIGADSKEVGEKIKGYYSSFCQGEIVVTDIRTAEVTKVVENTYRAVNIAFANELSRICRHDNLDDVRESPTIQMLECQERHLAQPLLCYDPFITKDIVARQSHDFDEFLDACDMVVIMVKHDQILTSWDKMKGKVILDCHNICPLEGVYHI